MKRLCISGKARFSRSVLNSIPVQYPELRSLSVNHENVSDDLIVCIGSHCKNLLRLEIRPCPKIADKSFKCLAQCTLLQELLLGNAVKLSEATLKHLLRSCKDLRRLALPMSLIQFEYLEVETIQSNSLTSLDLTLASVTDSSVYTIARSFPSLMELCLSNCEEITDECLSVIETHCKNLKILNISYSGIPNFNDNFESFLQQFGHLLHSLDISGMKFVKTAVLGKCCSQLHELSMNHCQSMRTEWIASEQGGVNADFSNEESSGKSLLEACPFIKSLHIDAENTHAWGIPFDVLSLLRNARDLRKLSLTHIPDFSDTLLENVLEYISTDSITSLNVSGNKGITTKGIWLAIQKLKSVRTLRINECDVINKEYNDLVNMVNKFKFDIEIIRCAN